MVIFDTDEYICEIDNYSTDLWQRQNIGLHTYIPSVIFSIWAFYKSFIVSD